MSVYRIGVLNGDGIGPEIVSAAVNKDCINHLKMILKQETLAQCFNFRVRRVHI